MNTRLGLDEIPNHELRIGVTDSRLYYWHINTDPDEWVHVLAEQKFYMSKEDKIQLIDEMRKHLHIRRDGKITEYYLNDLISQLTRLNKPAANRINRYEGVHSFDGEVMNLIGDLKGKSIEDFKSVILHIGTKKATCVSNLRFPEIHKFRMRFVGIAESDCSLDHEGRFFYYEKEIERQRIAINFFHEFGDFRVKRRKDNAVQIYLPRSFGVLAECWGIPYGDKAIHNIGLHESIINENIIIKMQYLREMVPEDGSICGTVVSIRRHNVLHAGKRMEKYRNMYGIEPVVNQKHIQFVIDEGTPQKSTLCYEDGDVIRLHLTKIQNISKDKTNRNSHIAKDLLRIIDDNKQRLLYDEKTHMIKPLGINMNIRERFVQYYTDSQRLALSSYGSTATKEDAIRWVLIAPPNHPIKMKAAIELITSNVEYSRKIAEQIKEDRLPVDSSWEEYLK
jgi:hypothetical protein